MKKVLIEPMVVEMIKCMEEAREASINSFYMIVIAAASMTPAVMTSALMNSAVMTKAIMTPALMTPTFMTPAVITRA